MNEVLPTVVNWVVVSSLNQSVSWPSDNSHRSFGLLLSSLSTAVHSLGVIEKGSLSDEITRGTLVWYCSFDYWLIAPSRVARNCRWEFSFSVKWACGLIDSLPFHEYWYVLHYVRHSKIPFVRSRCLFKGAFMYLMITWLAVWLVQWLSLLSLTIATRVQSRLR